MTRKLPLVRSQKELALDEDTAVVGFQDEDTINTVEEQTRLKDIPVPLSLPQERACGTDSFQLPETFLRSPPPDAIPVPERDDVDWDIDPDGFRFLRELNKGNKGYTGPEVSEEVFERVVDRFEKAVKADVLPLLPALETTLASIVPDVAAIKVAYGWWVQRRKQLAMPLIRELRPAPDPEDPDTTGVAFRPREKEGIRRLRSNNKKTYNLMAQLHDEFKRLQQIAELIKQRERIKLEFHKASGEYTEAAHRTLANRLVRQRTDPRGGWKDELDEPTDAGAVPQREQRISHHKKRESVPPAHLREQRAQPQHSTHHHSGGSHHKSERSHKKRHGVPGRPLSSHHQASAGMGRPRSHSSHSSHSRPLEVDDGAHLRGVNERVSAIDDVDSEEEAYTQMVLMIDTSKRDELQSLLPLHLRQVADRPDPAEHEVGAKGPVAEQGANATGGTVTPTAVAARVPSVATAEAAPTAARLPSCVGDRAAASIDGAIVSLGGHGSAVAAPVAQLGDVDGASAESVRVSSRPMPKGAGTGRNGRVRGLLRIGRGGRVILDRGGRGSGHAYQRLCWSSTGKLPPLLAHVLSHGRAPPAVLEQHVDPDVAWRQNRPLQIKRGPILYNFGSLPKPAFVSSSREGAPAPETEALARSRGAPSLVHEVDTGLPLSAPNGEAGASAAAAPTPTSHSESEQRRALGNGRKRKSPDGGPEEGGQPQQRTFSGQA